MNLKTLINLKFIISLICYSSFAHSEPFVVLEYRSASNNITNSENSFLKDENFSLKHKVKKNETLTDIILKYYGFKYFNKDILSLSIVHFNKHAFVRKNPNYLFAGKVLYLPSVKEIQNLLLKLPKSDKSEKNFSNRENQIYFFGG
tara:strand:+ start:1004 stop:1441 length:438 start_codon:yes stop_codon:yes gene_type:complete